MSHTASRVQFNRPISRSLAIHFAIAAAIWFSGSITQKFFPENRRTEIEIVEVPASPKKNPSEAEQIVRSDATKTKEADEKAKYLSDANRVAEIEKVSQTRTGAESSKPKAASKAAEKVKSQVAQAIKPSTMTKAESHKLLSNMGIKIAAPEQKAKDTPEWKDYQKDFGQVKGEYIRGIKQGETTALNTREFVFFSYFQRIREQLDRSWNDTLKADLERFYRKGRTLASDMDHVTRTLVVLNDHGEVTRVKILEESGTRDLDDAAVKSFNSAGPFPNPPRGIINSKGEIEIRWDFVLKT